MTSKENKLVCSVKCTSGFSFQFVPGPGSNTAKVSLRSDGISASIVWNKWLQPTDLHAITGYFWRQGLHIMQEERAKKSHWKILNESRHFHVFYFFLVSCEIFSWHRVWMNVWEEIGVPNSFSFIYWIYCLLISKRWTNTTQALWLETQTIIHPNGAGNLACMCLNT